AADGVVGCTPSGHDSDCSDAGAGWPHLGRERGATEGHSISGDQMQVSTHTVSSHTHTHTHTASSSHTHTQRHHTHTPSHTHTHTQRHHTYTHTHAVCI